MNEPLIYYSFNLCAALFSIYIIAASLIRNPEHTVRPAFIISVLLIVFYQLPLVYFSKIFAVAKMDFWLFAASIHIPVFSGIIWVMNTPKLNSSGIYKEPSIANYKQFNKFELWFSVVLYISLVATYLYKVPFNCTALYTIFFAQPLAVFVREVAVKLAGTNYSTYALSILSTTLIPIVAFLSIRMAYDCLYKRKLISTIFWLVFFAFVFMSSLLSGAKGNLIPTFIVLTIAGFLSTHIWYKRLANVFLLNSLLVIVLILFGIKRAEMPNAETSRYDFSYCVKKLHICEEAKTLLDSLKFSDFALDLTKNKIASLEQERKAACENPEVSLKPTAGYEQKTTPIELDPETTHPDSVSKHIQLTVTQNDKIKTADNKEDTETVSISHKEESLTENEKYIINEHAKAKFIDKVEALVNRAFVIPLVVAHWHFLYVEEYGRPGFAGLSIARRFSSDYINMPSKVCDVYETIRSGGDRTSTCTAPTSYLFTYPAYMGIWGLIAASVITIIFDIFASLLIKFSSVPINYLAIALMVVAGINFMTADFTTVMLSHGAGAAFALLIIFRIYRLVFKY